MTSFPAGVEQQFRALNDLRIERLRAALAAPARLAFDALPDRLLASTGDTVLGLYLMGSAGTFGQGQGSDLDLWVVCSDDADRAALDACLQQQRDWCHAHGLDLRAFLVNPLELRAGTRSMLAGDDCGSTQDRLLLDEFYRTAVLLRGAAPLWWLIAPDDELRYDELAPALAGPGYLDLGGIPSIPDDEFLGATLWHLHKAIEAPHKSLLKLLLLEAYALDGGEPLALQFKRQVYAADVDIEGLDPYLLMHARIERYLLQRHDQSRLHLARVCLLRKADSSHASQWQLDAAAQLRRDWGWEHTSATGEPGTPGPSGPPGIAALLQEHAEIARQLDAGHSLLRQWADAMPGRLAADRDLQLLEAELAVHTLDWPGKVVRLNAALRKQLSETELLLQRAGADWRVTAPGDVELLRNPSLAHIVSWSCLNGLWPTDRDACVEARTYDLLRDALAPLVGNGRPDAEDLLQPPVTTRQLLFLLTDDSWQIEQVSLNSWGEVSARCIESLEALGTSLAGLDADALDAGTLEVHAPLQVQRGRMLRELLQRRSTVAAGAQQPLQQLLLEGAGRVLCLATDSAPPLREFETTAALFAHLHALPMRSELRGEGPLLAPLCALQAAWRASATVNARAHLLLIPNADGQDALALIDRDGALYAAVLAQRPLPHLQDALRLFLANAGRRLRIGTRAWVWRHALTPLVGRVYLPERVRLRVRTDGGLDLDCADARFPSIDSDADSLAAARAQILGLRRNGHDYPITITDVVVAEPASAHLRDLLGLKLRGEALLAGR